MSNASSPVPSPPFHAAIVAEGSLRRAASLALLDPLGFGYVVRICGHVHVEGARHAGLLQGYPLAEREEFDPGWMSCREPGVTGTRIVARWMRGSDEPWHLATNSARSLEKLCEACALRMEEEERFRDLKSHRYGAGLRYVRLADRSPGRIGTNGRS